MSYSATIARVDPEREIASEEWVQFARLHPQLILESTDVPAATARHKDGPKNLRIFWSNGCINCGAPTPAIIRVMFECASELNAVVLGPKGHRYTCLEDWEQRTHISREQRTKDVGESGARRRRDTMKVLLKVLVGLLLACLLFYIRKL